MREHRDALLDPLKRHLMSEGLTFERGFPARGRMKNEYGPRRIPEWSTFVEMDFSSGQFLELVNGHCATS